MIGETMACVKYYATRPKSWRNFVAVRQNFRTCRRKIDVAAMTIPGVASGKDGTRICMMPGPRPGHCTGASTPPESTPIAMNDFSAAFALAARLIVGLDPDLVEIVALSLYVSVFAVRLATVFGAAARCSIGMFRFPGRRAVIILLNALMGLPPVVVGLVVYMLLSRSGPLGEFGLLFTPAAMIIAQFILVVPIVAALTRQTVQDLHEEYDEHLRSLGASRLASRRHVALGRPLPVHDRRTRRLRPRHRRGRRGADRGRQHPASYPGDDHHHRTGDQQGQSCTGPRRSASCCMVLAAAVNATATLLGDAAHRRHA
jgi:ABC-type glycerol-3-phosphate transport system permease component